MTKQTGLKLSLLNWLCTLSAFLNAQTLPITSSVRARRANNLNGGIVNNAFVPEDVATATFDGNNMQNTLEAPVGAHLDKKDMVAVLHVGPKRTGTSTIQIRAQQMRRSLNNDGYFLPGQFADGVHPTNMYQIATCFETGDDQSHHINQNIACLPELANAISDIATSGSHVLITAERFSLSSVDVKTLKEELFDPNYENVQVVVYYRRFYDWLLSKWAARNEEPQFCFHTECDNLVDFINDFPNVQDPFQDDYTNTVANRYMEYFENVNVINEYDMGTDDAAEYFFCNVMPNATETCGTYIEKEDPVLYKVRDPPIYRYLVVAAIELKLLDVKKYQRNRIREIAELAKFQHEVKNGKSEYNFSAKRCPDDEALDYLLQLTLNAERELFPKYFRQRGKFEITRDFNRAKTTKLCSIDPKAVIQEDPEWQTFFENVQNGNLCRFA